MSAAILDKIEACERDSSQGTTWNLLPPVELPGDCWAVTNCDGIADKTYSHTSQRNGNFVIRLCSCFHPIIVQSNGNFYTKYELMARKIGRCSITFINNLGEKRTFDFITK